MQGSARVCVCAAVSGNSVVGSVRVAPGTPQGTATSVTRCALGEEDVMLRGLSTAKGVASLVSGEGRLERKTLHAKARHRTHCHSTEHTTLGTARTVTRVTEAREDS
ncbi:hypothetical protein E2C01_090945 [Portunus trituberculatus]|uniref:Uncharacterized protein n=1 Tax=Portunus trituberculatus TaxID=210409 RepID=A0A5B7JCP8_PORTR|nr:hypothetical protein [Portunus trituberculatus]